MKVQILAFGIIREIFGASLIEVLLQHTSVEELKANLEEKYPRLKQLASYMIAINNEYARAGQQINAADEIAIIPPVSGG